MTNIYKSDDILNVVREARKVIQTIVDTKDKDSQIKQALIFVLMLQSLEQLTQELVSCGEEDQLHGLELLDTAIARLEEDSDNDVGESKSPWFDPNNKGSA